MAIQLGVHRELNKSEEEFLKLKKLQARLSSARDSVPVTLRKNGTTETRKVCFKEGGLAHRVLSAV
ncbi:MAG: hypothetical protein QXT13_03560 [Pyrobaculum sp.]